MNQPYDVSGAAILVLHDGRAALAAHALERLRSAGFAAGAHELTPAARASDRSARAELDQALAELERLPAVDRARLAVVGFGRGGTLAFLLGCTRRLAAVVDVGGPVLHPALSAERPIQPLELGLNLEGVFLGLFARGGAVGAEERALLAERLTAAARPFDLVVHDAGEGFFDPGAAGYDAARAAELWGRLLAFLREHLAAEHD